MRSKSSSQAKHFAGAVSAKVYGEQDANYWQEYYDGLQKTDATGKSVHLGGSAVSNLADNMLLFGLVPGSANTFAATYRVFGDIVKAQYPNLVPSYASADQVLDTSYLTDIAKSSNFNPTAALGSAKSNVDATKATSTVSDRPYNIQFATGQASFTAATKSTLEELARNLLVAGNTVVEVHGHTDNQGSPQSNMNLSEKRAFAVQHWLEAKAPRNFVAGRIKVYAHGQTEPGCGELQRSKGRAKNRRVEITIKRVGT